MLYAIKILERALELEKTTLEKMKSKTLQKALQKNINDIESAIQILNNQKK